MNVSNRLEFTLVEGRNRQIRKMVESIGLKVLSLHRTAFANVTLRGVSEGNWAELNEREMEIIEKVIATSQERERRREERK
jgi:pseudouridine synthase